MRHPDTPTTAEDRGTALARLFGPLQDTAGAVGARTLLDADEAATMHAEGERLLDSFGLNAEFVPTTLGGRLNDVPELVRVMRVVYGRDACLGLGYGASALMASVNVWTAGDERQRRSLADLLLAGGKVATAYHELPHGNDFARASFRAVRLPGGDWRLTGRKEVIANARRADAFVLFARTGDTPGARGHSQFFVPRAALDSGRLKDVPRFRTSGLRGVQLGGVEFAECPVPAESVLGDVGMGIETAMRSFQVSRTALPGMWAGGVEAGLVTVLRFVSGRRLYGRRAVDIPLVRRELAECFADLMLCEALVSVAARALHVRPDQTAVLAPLTKQYVSGRLLNVMDRLSRLLGAHFYVRDGEHALFQKHLRDLAPVGFGHTGRAACLAAALPLLTVLSRNVRRSGTRHRVDGDGDADLFDLHAPLPPLDFGRLTLRAGQHESLAGALRAGADGTGASGRAHRAAVALLDRTHEGLAHLGARDVGPGGGAGPADLAKAYGVCLAAGACAGVARHARQGTADPFLSDPAWLTGVMTRAFGSAAPSLDPAVADRFFEELTNRWEAGLSLELSPRPLGM
ncbi:MULTISPECIES: acyl-CoA dehydrogenase [unclassified Streptomyces]|uniref:acyl-CoA dehydrogenase n=1 Tax=unclassified Streptomyces TaxID=2593676 RepID=UPI000DAEA290|nr:MULTISPECIES: acyl-CoA dehydrogenase [unclassified Streptomyces]PZT77069.1 acyl-CoA dehydrogenase [Streptomyces sp. AC1-42W]PZT78978.1 acyl-CoA dehydrogenase [Streptomyces sp. AC1-42T]